MPTKTSTPLVAFAAGAAVLGVALATGAPLAAVSAQPSISFSPQSGRWSDAAAIMTTDFQCLPGSPDDLPRMSGFISEVGGEAPVVEPDALVIPSVYPYTKPSSDLSSGLTNVVTNEDGTLPSSLTLDMFMPGTWFSGADFSELGDMSTELAPNSTYSFGLFCYSDATGTYQLDGDGRVHATSIPLYTNADGSWTFVQGSGPVDLVATAVDLTAELGADNASIEATATVRAIDGTGPLAEATGTVTFREGVDVVGTAPTTDGVAQTSITGLTAGEHRLTASYVPDAAAAGRFASSSASNESDTITIPDAGGDPAVDGIELTAGSEMTAGLLYKVSVAEDSFTAGDVVSGTIAPEGVTLAEQAEVAEDGSAVYGFTAPAGLASGSHELVLVDAHGASVTVAFTVVSGTPTPTPTSTASGTTTVLTGTASPASSPNAAIAFATGWVGGMASTPAGATTLFGSSLLIVAAVIGGWTLLLRRRSGRDTSTKRS